MSVPRAGGDGCADILEPTRVVDPTYPSFMTERIVPWLVALCVVGHLLLSLLWAVAVPPFEAHDETGHFAHVQYVATHLQLPPPGGVLTRWFDEAHQPPLYYWTVGVPGYLLDLGGDMKPDMNPFFLRGDQQGGINAAVHDPLQEQWLAHRWSALLLLARCVSALYSAAAVWLTFRIARLLLPDRPLASVLAAALAGATPTFVYLSGAANNDAAIAATGSAAILACLLWLRANVKATPISATAPVSVRRPDKGTYRAALAGLWIGAALMTKSSALPLLAALGLVPLLRLRARSIRPVIAMREYLVASSVCAVTAGWWYLHNLLRYGHLIMDRNVAGSIVEDPTLSAGVLGAAASSNFVVALVQNTFTSYWALFGWGNIAGPRWLYPACIVLVGTAALGLLLSPWSMRTRSTYQEAHAARVVALLLMLLLAALPLYRAVRFAAPTLVPGRYLFIGIAFISTALAAGLWSAVDRFPKQIAFSVRLMAPVMLVVASMSGLFANVLPAYAHPLLLGPTNAQAQIAEMYVSYDHKIALTGYSLPRAQVRPGDNLVVGLVWRAEARMTVSYTVSLQIVDADYHVVGRTDRLPGNGNFPTTLWQPGDQFMETYRVQLDPQKARSPQLGHLLVVVQEYAASTPGGDDFATRSVLRPLDGQQHETLPAFADLRLGPTPTPAPWRQPLYTLGSLAHILGVEVPTSPIRPGQTVTATLHVQSIETTRRRAVLFAHLLDAQGKVVAQQDTEPRVDDHQYPTTIWIPGELFSVALDVPIPSTVAPGVYAFEVGMYWQDNNNRLPVVDAAGKSVLDDRLLVKPIIIE